MGVSAPGSRPAWGRRAAHAVTLLCALCLPVAAQPKPGKPTPGGAASPTGTPAPKSADPKPADPKPAGSRPGKSGGGKDRTKEQNFNFEGLGLAGHNRSPQLLYFLERANEELERASLEKRSFISHMVRSVEEEAL